MADKIKVKQEKKLLRQVRSRSKIFGTANRPRLTVFRSLNHIYAQIINDQTGQTLTSAKDTEIKAKGKPVEIALAVGKLIAQKASEKKITEVIFDRGGYLYHGRIKALADGAREGGLKF